MSTQSADIGTIVRSTLILRFLATAGRRGLALTEIASRTHLPHGTVHRLLKQMSDVGMTFQCEDSRRYLLGPLAYELGLAASHVFDFRSACGPVLERLSRETEDTVYFVMRSGLDAVCIDRVEGTFPIRTITLEVGSRRPLGVGAGGLAILSACEDQEIERILEATSPRLAEFNGLKLDDQMAAIEATRRQGYALIKNRVTLGVTAIGIAFRDTMRRPVGALSIGAIDSRMRSPRRKEIVRLLQDQVRQIEKSMRERRPIIA